MRPGRLREIAALLVAAALPLACSSTPGVKRQEYAALRDHRTYEYEFPFVWESIENTLSSYRVMERDPEEVTPLDLRKLTRRTAETDWIYGKSRDKYVEYMVDGFPRKKYLQVRVRYQVTAESVVGGTKVTVATAEEVERLDKDGTSAGYDKAETVDSSRANEVLERIRMAILKAAP